VPLLGVVDLIDDDELDLRPIAERLYAPLAVGLLELLKVLHEVARPRLVRRPPWFPGLGCDDAPREDVADFLFPVVHDCIGATDDRELGIYDPSRKYRRERLARARARPVPVSPVGPDPDRYEALHEVRFDQSSLQTKLVAGRDLQRGRSFELVDEGASNIASVLATREAHGLL